MTLPFTELISKEQHARQCQQLSVTHKFFILTGKKVSIHGNSVNDKIPNNLLQSMISMRVACTYVGFILGMFRNKRSILKF